MNRSFNVWLLVVALLAPIVTYAAGRGQVPQVTPITVGVKTSTETGNYRGPYDISDLTTSSDLEGAVVTSDTPAVYCGGFANVSVTGLLSSSGATCVVDMVRYRGSEFRGRERVTLTAATSSPTVGSLYPSQTSTFATQGCDSVRFIRAQPSAGTCSLRTEVY